MIELVKFFTFIFLSCEKFIEMIWHLITKFGMIPELARKVELKTYITFQ